MSERKYRQRGYMEEERPARPQAKPPSGAPRGVESRSGPRTFNMPGFREVVRCAQCGGIITAAIGLESTCSRCRADLHTCAQCVAFDSSARFECSRPVPARISPKNVRNTCDLFEPRTTVERETGSTGPTTARQAFDDLFK